MAFYAASVPLKRELSLQINFLEVLWEAHVLTKKKSTYKELESFQDFLERLDSKAREMMSASLRRGVDAIRKFGNEEMDPDSMMEILKKVKEECHNSVASRSSVVVSKSKRVGLSDVRIQLKEDLLVPYVRDGVFEALTLVEMPGVGKTTLAREIFEDLDIIEWFDCRVWVTVGVEWTWPEIAQAILAQVDPGTHEEASDQEIAIRLKESLKDRRFVLVLDDVWNKKVHTYMERSLPDSKNGSQILVTTRSKLVAGATFLEVRLLNEEESWHLLRDRVFDCPPQLEHFGKKIAKKCDGLPLTIVTVADLLSKAEELLWIDVATKKKHQVFIEVYDKISEVLYPSYEYLNIQDKACFLYMGLFPLKSKIPGSKLINLWIAEGMVPQGKDGTLEFNGALILSYLNLLGLVMIHQRSSGLMPSLLVHGIKTFGLHSSQFNFPVPPHVTWGGIGDLSRHSSWWHFCQKEAQKNNSSNVLDCFGDAFEEGMQSQGWSCNTSKFYT